MGQIYSSARRVIVWVGPKSEDSDLAIDRITTIASRVKVNFQTAQLSPITDDLHWADYDEPLQLSDTEHTALFRFYSRSWFERIWVWQKVHLAADALVLCGDRSVNWDAVKTGVVCLGLKPRPEMAEWPAPEAAFSMATFPMTKNFPLRALLHKTKDAKCLDPRDRVFALLSFLDEDMQSKIVPNYNKSAQEIYEDVVLQHFEICHPDGPRLLSMVEIRKEIPESPSWVPRWDLPRLTTRLYHSKSALETLPSIRRRSRAAIEATGVYVTEISRAEPINLWNDVGQQEVIDEIKRLKEHILTSHGQNLYPFLETLTANYIAERHHPAYAWRPSTKYFPRFLDFVFGDNGLRDPSVDRVIKNILEFGPGRALCTTTDGKLCLGLVGTRPGDIVTVFLGCDSPLVLRPTTPDCLQYWVVGEAFCHGVMDGEALLGPLPEHWQLVIRHDRTSYVDWSAFWNSKSQQFSAEDPRLGNLPEGWRRQSHENEEFQTSFIRDIDGEILETWEDPRIAMDELRLRGVQLKTFELV
jgi:hypothetical protein